MKNVYVKILLIVAILFAAGTLEAQVIKGVHDRTRQKIKQRANNRADREIDKKLDEAEKATEVKKDEDGNKGEKDQEEEVKTKKTDGGSQDGTNGSTATTFTTKYDFVPGEKVIAFEDFSTTEIGDFPTRWNTNATAEVVTLNNKEGKWLKINKEGVWHPEFITNLPENFTLEFDLGVSTDFDGSSFVVNIGNLANREADYTDLYHFASSRHGHYLHMNFSPNNGRVSARTRIATGTTSGPLINNDVEHKGWDNTKNSFAHISLWRQAQRLRIYVNGEKVFDLPRAFEANGKYNTLTFAMQGSYKPDEYHYFLSNVRLASGAADTRNKLITEGKFVTRGILFDVNSDKIKPESYGALKDIANVLKENGSVRVKIVGHTDTDGDDAKNMDLSKRRAASVKNLLVKEFGVAENNLETDGKGETAPVDKNTTAEAKANNRRVEFIKL